MYILYYNLNIKIIYNIYVGICIYIVGDIVDVKLLQV